jgi:hypothetical protein
VVKPSKSTRGKEADSAKQSYKWKELNAQEQGAKDEPRYGIRKIETACDGLELRRLVHHPQKDGSNTRDKTRDQKGNQNCLYRRSHDLTAISGGSEVRVLPEADRRHCSSGCGFRHD